MTRQKDNSLLIEVLYTSLERLSEQWGKTKDPRYVQQYHAAYNHMLELGWNGEHRDLRYLISHKLMPGQEEKHLKRLLHLENKIRQEVATYVEIHGPRFNKDRYTYLRRNGVRANGVDIDRLLFIYPDTIDESQDDNSVSNDTLIHTLHEQLFDIMSRWHARYDPQFIEQYHAIYNHLVALGWNQHLDIEEEMPSGLMPPHRAELSRLLTLEKEISDELVKLRELAKGAWDFDVIRYRYLRRLGAKRGSIDVKKISWSS